MTEIVVVETSYPSAIAAHPVLEQPWSHLSLPNLVFHSCMKHLAIDYHFVCDLL